MPDRPWPDGREPLPGVEPVEPVEPWVLADDDWAVPPEDDEAPLAYTPIIDSPIEPEPAPPPRPAPRPSRVVDLASAALVMALVVLLTGLLTATTGLADDDDDVATGESTTTTTTGEPASSTSAFVATLPTQVPATTSTTTAGAGASATTATTTSSRPSGGTPTTIRRTTTTRPSTPTTIPGSSTSTTAALVNRPMTTEITWEPAQPVAGQVVTVTVVWSDPDAAPTPNCSVVSGDDGIAFPESDCEDEECPVNPSMPAQGGTRTFVFNHTFDAPGAYEVSASGRSGDPECGNPYASRDEVTATIDVASAD